MPEPRKAMTKGEREELLRLVRSREKVLKSSCEQRSAEMLAEFESKLSKTFKFDETATWAAAAAKVQESAKEFQAKIFEHLDSLGIPREFAPICEVRWYDRGSNSAGSRRDELRRLAKSQIAAAEQKARVEVERLSVDAQAEIVESGITSEGAMLFFKSMTPIENLMPTLDLKAIEDKYSQSHGGKPLGLTLIPGGLDDDDGDDGA